MVPEMNFEDDEFRRMLRDVAVPPGLESRLRSVMTPRGTEDSGQVPGLHAGRPDRRARGRMTVPGKNRVRHWLVVSLAAAAGFGTAVWIWVPRSSSRPGSETAGVLPSAGDAGNGTGGAAGHGVRPERTAGQIGVVREFTARLQLEKELQNLRHQRAELQAAVFPTGSQVRERSALGLVFGSESARELGAPESFVVAELENVVRLFPETDGSDRARRLLSEYHSN